MTDGPRCSPEEADAAIEAHYGGYLANEDPEWWRDMVDLVMRYGIEWLENPT